jgi:hypothetical protein
MNYQTIKNKAKELQCSVKDLIVLSQQNDPFYCGTKMDIKLAEWFAQLWEKFGFVSDIHLRRIHYRIISQDPSILLPNGNKYQNTENCWGMLGRASAYARYLHLVDPAKFDDRRNSKPLIFFDPLDVGPYIEINGDNKIFNLSLPGFPDLPSYEIEDYKQSQRYHLEIWGEKSTMNDLLYPLCERNEVNLITGVGEMSITQVRWLIERFDRYKKSCRIFYVSDFDPAGLSMPVAVSRKIEKFLYDSENIYDVKLFPLVLTFDQCVKYKLPRTPLKDTELRKESFEVQYGKGATELDALEALQPGELEKILLRAINSYRDKNLSNKVFEAKSDIYNELEEITEAIINEYTEEINELNIEYRELSTDFEGKFEDLTQRIKNLWQAIKNEMDVNMPDIDDYPLPKPEIAEEIENDLFDSSLDYFEQLKKYKRFQGK